MHHLISVIFLQTAFPETAQCTTETAYQDPTQRTIESDYPESTQGTLKTKDGEKLISLFTTEATSKIYDCVV